MAVELIDRRTKTTKVFDLGGGQRLYRCCLGNIHYPDPDGDFQEIDTTLVSKAGGFYQDKCFYKCEVPDKADGIFSFFNQDHFFDVRLVGVNSVGYKPIPGSPWGALGKGIQYTDAFGPGVHFEVMAKNNGLHKQIRFDQPPARTDVDFIVVFEVLSKPDTIEYQDSLKGQLVTVDPTKTDVGAVRIDNKITRMFNAGGKGISYLRFPKAWDSSSLIKTVPVKLVYYSDGGKDYFLKIIPKEIFQGATYPVFADDPVTYYSGAGDGWLENSSFAAWDTAHDATTGNAIYTSTIAQIGSLAGSPSTAFLFLRAFISADTSAIGGDTVTAATVYIYGISASYRNHDNDGDDWLTIVEGLQANDTSLVSADFDDCGDAIDNPTEGIDAGDRIDITGYNQSGYNSFALNATGRGWVDGSGYTKLGIREGHDVLDNPLVIGGAYQGNTVKFSTSEETGTGQDPYLDITASAGAGNSPTGTIYGPLVGPLGGVI